MKKEPLITVQDLTAAYAIPGRGKIHAVSDVSFEIGYGETLGLVGESGCGKSTLARSLVGLQKPSGGQIRYNAEHISQSRNKSRQPIRPGIQMIFQDAIASLNPGRKIGKTIEEPLRLQKKFDRQARQQAARKMMQTVGLAPDQIYSRYPSEASGGQCQRASLARALITKPKFLVCDEPVSSLDVSVQAQILNLLEEMKRQFNLTMLFISHDLAVIKNISDRVAVMYLGRLCEIAPTDILYRTPRHPYTKMLLDAVPHPGHECPAKEVDHFSNEMPSSVSPPDGCRFHTRCPKTQSICKEVRPELAQLDHRRQVACHFPLPG